MPDTKRLIEAAGALSSCLSAKSIRHAFHGSLFVAILANSPQCDEIVCIADVGNSHPFRRVREAITGREDLTSVHSPWTNRLHVTYHRPIPAIVEIEILPAGEEGPRRLDNSTVARMAGLPFLTISEFVRAKLRSWTSRHLEHDARDIMYVLNTRWQQIDINRIPEQDMDRFVMQNSAARAAWSAIKKRYGL